MEIQDIIEELQFLSLEELLVVQVNLEMRIEFKKYQKQLIKDLGNCEDNPQ
jgi:hypothetical protein